MHKSILVMTGSPRKGGNSDMLAEAFIRGAKSRGHSVTLFRAAAKHIGGCRACGACWDKGRACSFADGFTELEPLVESADAVVFASPLYWFSFSSQIKAAIDRLNAYDSAKALRPLKVRESALLVCGAGDDPHIFDGIISTYKSMSGYMGWTDRGVLAVAGVQERGEVAKGHALAQAEALGAAF